MVNITIEYCAVCNYTDRAIDAMTEVVKNHEFKTGSIVLVPSDNGKFEVTVGNQLIFSKLQTGRNAEEGEIARIVGDVL
jgi:selenoprotein W-related protein